MTIAKFVKLWMWWGIITAAGFPLWAEEKKGGTMSYAEAKAFLDRHTEVIELADGKGAFVAVTPEWQGRVMTSTCGSPTGPSFGFINREFIEAGRPDPHFSNYGGEDRFWLCPEGGQFSLWFKPGAKQNLENWFTPPALNEGAWQAEVAADNRAVRMSARLKFQNASATHFELDVARRVRLLTVEDFAQLFGHAVAGLLKRNGVQLVAYETDNQITNLGSPLSKEKGLVSIWILGMLTAGPKTVVIVPYKPGPEAELGPVVKADYFGVVPKERLRVTPQAVLFLGDGKYRSKIGISQRRARAVLGSMDFESGVLTLVHFTMPDDPTKCIYLNNMWELPQKEPYVGDVVNSYNDGPNELGRQLGNFYEIESISPAEELKSGRSLRHCHRTVHLRADAATLHAIAEAALGVDLDVVRNTFFSNE